MAGTSRNRPKSASVSKSAIDQAGSLLQDLSAKPREEMSLREAIDQLREPIQSAMAKGYNYEDIVKVLADEGIRTTVTTVKRYVSLSNPKRRRSAAKTRTKRAESAIDSEPELEPVVKPGRKAKTIEPEVEETVKPVGRRRASETASAAKTKASSKTSSSKSRATTTRTPKTTGRGGRKKSS